MSEPQPEPQPEPHVNRWELTITAEAEVVKAPKDQEEVE